MWFVKSCLVFIIWKWSDASVGLFIPTVGLFLELFSWHQSVTTVTTGSNGSIYRCRKRCTVSVLVQPLKVMDLFVEGTINIFRSQLIALLLEPSLFDNVHLLVQKLLDLQEKFNEFASLVEFSDYEQN